MKKIYSYLQGIKGIFLILYMHFIICADIRLCDYPDAVKARLYLIVLAALIVLCPALIRLFRRISVRHTVKLENRKVKLLWLAVFFLLCAAAFGLAYAAYYPGAFSADSITQYKQAVSGEYNNWHPVLHTLLGFTLPLAITGGWSGSIVLFQLIYFSLAAAYTAYTVLRHSNAAYAVVSLVFILINPATTYISMYPWKDVPFAVTAMLIAAYAANTYFTKGEWLKKRSNLIAAIAVLVLATVFRHNALLFTIPMLIAMLLYLNRKAAVTAALCFLAAVILIEGPFYAILKVEQPGDRQTEMLGVPVAVVGEVAARNPSALDDDMRTFIYKVAPAESWENNYRIGCFNTVKFLPGTDYSKIGEEGAFKVVGYMLRCFVKSPKEAFSALIAATDIVYTLSVDDTTWSDIYPAVIDNDVGISYHGNRYALDIESYITSRMYTYMKGIFWYVGAMNLIIIIAALAKLRFRERSEWKRILMVLSMLLYNFGTMLLLSGDDFRFFYYTFTVTPVLLLLIMRKNDDIISGEADAGHNVVADSAVPAAFSEN